jgi:hypothetical protein
LRPSGRCSGLKPLFDSVFALAAQLESGTGDELDIAEQLIDVLGNIVDSTRRLVNTTRRDLPFPLDQDEFWQEFPRDLVDGAIAGHLELERPGIYALLHLLGLLEVEDVSPGKPGRVRYRRQRLRWDRLATVARGPREVASVVYGWGQGPGQFRHERFLRAVQLISWASDFASRAGPPTASCSIATTTRVTRIGRRSAS